MELCGYFYCNSSREPYITIFILMSTTIAYSNDIIHQPIYPSIQPNPIQKYINKNENTLQTRVIIFFV